MIGTKMEMEHMIEAGEEKNEENDKCSEKEMDVDEVQLAKKRKRKRTRTAGQNASG